ncbi:hypothetical protein [Fundidesulfovibrio putealis]|uniref:hypothetical protein n=1 Tax=Fundidesulfovibrio putealis TaxID=270496 RepID=UPI000418B7C6|nr:hypothetical protein [Fundidesulfovibrio putealis]
MSQDDSTARIESYLASLRRLKETSSPRREVLERELLLAVLQANRERLAESPALEADQQHLTATIVSRAEPLLAHTLYREWASQFLVVLNQYEVAARTGATAQASALLDQLLNLESLLSKCLQGYIIFSGLIRDDFNDVILKRFGESALADIDEISHAGFSDDNYWKALLDRFVFGFIDKSFAEMLNKQQFKLSRDGAFVAVRFPLDAMLAEMPGTDKEIDKTRLQSTVEAARTDPMAMKAAAALTALLPGLDKPLLPSKSPRQDYEALALVASLDPEAGRFVSVFVDGLPLEPEEGHPADEDPKLTAQRASARKEFLRNQMVAMAAGAALALGITREDLGKAIQNFTAREQERILTMAGALDPASLAVAHTLMLEFALCRLLTDKTESEGAKVQVKCLRQRRASRSDLDALAAKGFNRIRQKLFFEEDPSTPEWLYFKAKSPQELAEATQLSNMEPHLTHGLLALWNRQEFKVEAVTLVNMTLVAKATQNVQAKLGEILGKLGVVKTAQE